MTLGDGFPAVSGTVDSTELRKALAGLILRDTSGNARAGIFPAHTNALVSAKASMAVDVAAFTGCAVRGGGPIFMANDGTVTVSVDAAPGSNSRIDVVYFKQNESASPYSDANDNPIFGVEKGTAGAVPVKPTVPTGAVELATVLIPAGVSATNAGGVVITQTFQYTALTGTPLWVRNSTERSALGTYAAGTLALQLDTMVTYRHSGSGWAVWESPWISYNPTLGNVTLGSGTRVGRYCHSAGRVIVEGSFVLGAGSAVGSAPTVSNPVNADSASILVAYPSGEARFYDDGATLYDGVTAPVDASRTGLYARGVGGTYATVVALSASIPFGFGTGDSIVWRYEYTPA